MVPTYCGTHVLWYPCTVVPSGTCGIQLLWYPVEPMVPHGNHSTQWYHGTQVLRYPEVPWYPSTEVPSGTMVPRYCGVQVPSGTMVPSGICSTQWYPQYPGTMVPKYCGTQWYHGTQVIWHHVLWNPATVSEDPVIHPSIHPLSLECMLFNLQAMVCYA